ncbi:MAG: hypothetical protein JO069_17540 [Verrucomicrobia bacterium]|nr:hypothetical protein [Verrucomicrobiota bacterium]
MHPENAAFLREVARLVGVTPEEFINLVFYAAFTAQASVPGWFISFLKNLSLPDRASAERVADFINERVAEELLEGRGCMITAEVSTLANGRFGIDAHVLYNGEWRPYGA